MPPEDTVINYYALEYERHQQAKDISLQKGPKGPVRENSAAVIEIPPCSNGNNSFDTAC